MLRHSLDELTQIVYRYYPRGTPPSDTERTEKYRFRVDACRRAHAERKPFQAMLDRLQAAIPGSEVSYDGMHLADGGFDTSYSANVELSETDLHRLRIHVSVIAPYYLLLWRRAYCVPGTMRPTPAWMLKDLEDGFIPPPPHDEYSPFEESFDFSPDQEHLARLLATEIESTYPGYQLMPPEIGHQVVPEVTTDMHLLTFPTLYHCLFASHL